MRASARDTVFEVPRHEARSGAVSGRQRKHGRKPASCAAAAEPKNRQFSSFAVRAGYLVLDRAILQSFAKFTLAGVILGAALWFAARLAAVHLAQMSAFRDEATLAILVAVGAIVYAGSVLPLFGRRWLTSLVR